MIDTKITTNNDMIARTYVTDSPTNGYIQVNQSYGNTVFSYNVSEDNLLTADNIVVIGTVYATDGSFAGEVKASSGNIGGWKIATDSSKALYYDPINYDFITTPIKTISYDDIKENSHYYIKKVNTARRLIDITNVSGTRIVNVTGTYSSIYVGSTPNVSSGKSIIGGTEVGDFKFVLNSSD